MQMRETQVDSHSFSLVNQNLKTSSSEATDSSSPETLLPWAMRLDLYLPSGRQVPVTTSEETLLYELKEIAQQRFGIAIQSLVPCQQLSTRFLSIEDLDGFGLSVLPACFQLRDLQLFTAIHSYS